MGQSSVQAAGGTEPELITLHATRLDFKGKKVHLWNGFTVKTTEYSFDADELNGTLTAPFGKGSAKFQHAVVTGNTAENKQVIATLRSVAKAQPADKSDMQSYTQEIHADKAVFDNDPTGKTDGAIVFTGHVTMITRSAQLAAPGNTTFGQLTVTLGKAPDYPQIQGDSVDATFIPDKGAE